jgi:hypothetical protein
VSFGRGAIAICFENVKHVACDSLGQLHL